MPGHVSATQVAVEIVEVALQVVEPTADRLVRVDADAIQRCDTGRRQRERRTRTVLLLIVERADLVAVVREAVVARQTLLRDRGVDDVQGGLVDDRFRYADADVARRAQGQHLTDDDRHVGFTRVGLVAPAALFVLRVHDEVDRELQLVLDVLAVGHAVDLGQEERRERVAVHP